MLAELIELDVSAPTEADRRLAYEDALADVKSAMAFHIETFGVAALRERVMRMGGSGV